MSSSDFISHPFAVSYDQCSINNPELKAATEILKNSRVTSKARILEV